MQGFVEQVTGLQDQLQVMQEDISTMQESVAEMVHKEVAETFGTFAAGQAENLNNLTEKIDSVCADVERLKLAPSPPRNYAQAAAAADHSGEAHSRTSEGELVSKRRHTIAEPIPPEVSETSLRRVWVDNFLGDTKWESRISETERLLAELGTMHRYPGYFVGAFERTGKKSWILFKTPDLAQQFLKDNRTKFSDLSIEAPDGDTCTQEPLGPR